MDQTTYSITFPMAMAALLALGGTLLSILVRKWISDSEKAQDAKDKETESNYQKATNDIVALASRIHDLEIELERRITREELKDLRSEFKADVQGMADNIIMAVRAVSGGQKP